jgi:hypothetical protein
LLCYICIIVVIVGSDAGSKHGLHVGVVGVVARGAIRLIAAAGIRAKVAIAELIGAALRAGGVRLLRAHADRIERRRRETRI